MKERPSADFEVSSVKVDSHPEYGVPTEDWDASGKLADETEDLWVEEDATLGCHWSWDEYEFEL